MIVESIDGIVQEQREAGDMYSRQKWTLYSLGQVPLSRHAVLPSMQLPT